ncbi:hypothetical protein HPP92_007582 [Vanilla planifolia]|uniref:Uncharacterized protein n=1 Tax=Vanilla planifolia TaxID=51239 RepID=A0A835V7U8_VANPL|nr:hypothetical protein HPP92_007582 [Vanilla planifolia]
MKEKKVKRWKGMQENFGTLGLNQLPNQKVVSDAKVTEKTDVPNDGDGKANLMGSINCETLECNRENYGINTEI